MNVHERMASLAAIDLDFPLVTRERRELDEHLVTCDACRRAAADLRADAHSLRAIANVAPADRVRVAFSAAVARPDRVFSFLLADLRPYVRLALIAALVAALTIGLLAAGLMVGGDRLLGLRSSVDSSRPSSAVLPFGVESAVVQRTIPVCPRASALRPDVAAILVVCGGELEQVSLDGSAMAPRQLVSGIADVATTADTIWAVGTDALVRLARSTGAETARVAAAGGDAVAADDHGVWVVRTSAASLVRVDPATNRVVAMIAVGRDPTGILLADGRVWVSNRASNTVSEIDPATNAVKATITVGAGPLGLAAAAGAIWVANDADGTISWLDPSTAVATTIPVDPQVHTSVFPAIAAQGDQSVWIVDAHPDLLVGIDAASRRIVRKVTVPGSQPAINGIDDLAILGGSMWVSDEAGTLRELTAP